MPRKNNSALECYKSISVARLIRELAKLPPTQKVAIKTDAGALRIDRESPIERNSNGNFLKIKK